MFRYLNLKNIFPKIFLLIVLASASSCGNDVTNTINGMWSIDSLVYKGVDIRNCLLSNLIVFHDKSINLPVTEDRCAGFEEFNENGNWKLIENSEIPILVNVNSKNALFKGNLRVEFYPDYNEKLLKMRLSSDSVCVICSKFLFDFDKNRTLVNFLSNKSQAGVVLRTVPNK